jgi:hypothetical protein
MTALLLLTLGTIAPAPAPAGNAASLAEPALRRYADHVESASPLPVGWISEMPVKSGLSVVFQSERSCT